ncbi:MAG: xanthine dehydrogenase family protein molybdopterin-binding subunit [Rhodospirillaceae bacterium]|nr:xanthine dehydrogenase family protein molybdopterin-binding subunit [Rhodospirillaceae bacterium]MBT4689429.1 xanthine dehydrogenase family protein molybdopterin-binding subunit [Rhodospirillaceae bacterium]MBT5079149.1 xanthine dehydrogenase family protein molybdopterin-binding subunit [Rhodospirillaceae bacterium]MBT5527485.1 xanthine dehydrogenase family protein molybdopterin-binding subunit [Rhodospirillaceae bacterium]MBT5878686.1 xanthine dehydrogenase family protein molybdopterin-bind
MGQGQFSADISPAGHCHAVMVRSPYPHAKIRAIDISQAMALPGVIAVLTGADAAVDGLGPIPHNPDWVGPPDATLRLPPDFDVYVTENTALPLDTVRYVGEAVAMVVAETVAAANDAAELVDVDYDVLPAVVHARAAMAPGAPLVWPACSENLALTCDVGDEEATERAFANAAHIVKFDGWIHRVTGSPMEPRAVVGEYDPTDGRYTLRTGSGAGVVRSRERLAVTLGVPMENCRAVFGDMGGNFGTRNAFFPEYALMPWAAKRVGRAVKWTATRQECFLSDYQARDLASVAELALDEDGNFLGLRGVNTMNLGAYTVFFWPLRKGLSMMQSVYRIPHVHFKGHAVLTNTAPTAVYRSAGRPEAIYMIERLIDLAADAHGFDRVKLRRRNLIPSTAMPYTNAVGATYDSGEYETAMDTALDEADWNGFTARRAASAERGLCRGVGVANYIEITSGIPRERAELKVCDDGFIELVVGTMSSGQGHETSFPQLLSDWLQIPFEKVRYIANDTDRVSVGGGSHSGRSMRLVSIALGEAVEELLANGKAIAAHILQAPLADIVFEDGAFAAPGGGSVDLWAVAKAAATLDSLPDKLRGGLEGAGDITNRAGGYPYGSHVCEVEVDPDTGHVDIVAWTGVDDVGLAVNPAILHGQAHGAVMQGVGQALLEEIHYDPDSAQLLSGSFMDYAMPRAFTIPNLKTVIMEVPASSHPHGIRPGGEGGTTPALGLLINAIVDALSEFGVKHVAMPATPQRVWQAIQDAKDHRL